MFGDSPMSSLQSSKSPSRTMRGLLSAAALLLLLALTGLMEGRAYCQSTYYWDTNPNTAVVGNDVTEGGAGTWDNVTANFTPSSTDSSAVSHVIWSSALMNTGLDNVVFAGTAGGAVTINTFASGAQLTGSTALGVNALTFNTNGYVLSGTQTFRFISNAANPTQTINVAPGVTAIINNNISQSGVTGYTTGTGTYTTNANVIIAGGGTLRVAGNNGSMGYIINAGTTLEANQAANSQAFSGFNMSAVNGTLRVLNANVLQPPGGLSGIGTFDMNGLTQTTGVLGATGLTNFTTGTLSVTNVTATTSATLNLCNANNTATYTGVISNGTGKISLSFIGLFAQGSAFNSNAFANQTFAGSNTYTGSTSHGRGSIILDFSNAVAPASNIFYNTGFTGNNPAATDGRLIFTRPTLTINTIANSASGTLATMTLTGKSSTTNIQSFNGWQLDANSAALVLINPNATANTVTLDLGPIASRGTGSVINFATTAAGTALSASAIVKTTSGTANSTLLDANGVAYATLGGRDWAAKNAANDTLVAATTTQNTVSAMSGNATTGATGGAALDTKLVANSTITTLQYANATNRSGISLGGNTLTTGGVLVSAAADINGNFLNNGTLKAPAAGTDVVLNQFAGGTSRLFGLNVVVADGSGATGFTKGGTGLTLLQGNNTYTGALAAQQGGLIITGTNNPSSTFINGSTTSLMGVQLPSTATTGNFIQIGNADTTGSIGSNAVSLGQGAILAIKRSDTYTLNSNVTGTGGITQGWSGTTVLLSGNKYTNIGDITATAGTLQLNYNSGATSVISDSSRLVLAGGTVESTSTGVTANNEVIRDFALLSGASTVTTTGARTGLLALGGFATTTPAGSTLNFVQAGRASATGANVNGILVNGGAARFTVAGNDWAVGAGTIATYAGYTALAAGSSSNTTNFLLNTPSVTLTTAAATTYTLKVDSTAAGGATTLNLNTTLSLVAGGLLTTGANDITIAAGTLSSGSTTNGDLLIHQNNTSTNGLTINSIIGNGTGTSTLTKSGPGKLVLGATNTYTGQTFLNGGTTAISLNANLGAAANGAQLNINNGTLQVSTNSVILSNGAVGTNNRNVVLNGVGGTFLVDSALSLTIGGSITGPGGLTKDGAGTLDIRNATYTGPTTITAGTLRYGATGIGDRSAFNVGASGTFDLFGFSNNIGSLAGSGIVTNTAATNATLSSGGLHSDSTFSGQLTNASNALSLDKFGAGTLTLTGGSNNYTGSTTVSGGGLVLNGSGIIPVYTGTAANGTSLNLSSATATFDISGISAGSLSIGSLAGVAGSTANIGSKSFISGGNNGTTTFAGVISGVGGSITKTAFAAANGTLTLSGVNTYTGTTTIDQGFLRARGNVLVSTDGPLGNSSTAIIAGTATTVAGGAFSTNVGLDFQPFGDADVLTLARNVDYSNAPNVSSNRSRLALVPNATGGLDTSRLLVTGDIITGTSGRGLEFFANRSGMRIELNGNITGSAALYVSGNNSAAADIDGGFGGVVRFSNLSRPNTGPISITVGTMVVDGVVGAAGTNSPIGQGNISLGDGNGGNTINVGGRFAIRGIALETAGSSFLRTLSPGGGTGITPTAGAQQALYGTGQVFAVNGFQFGGLNTTGTTTFSAVINPGSVGVSGTGTAGGAGGTNPISIVHNVQLYAANGGTTEFSGVISGATAPVLGSTGTPGAAVTGNNTRLTINQFRNHPNLDENRDGVADPGLANALVGNATTGTVVLSNNNSYGGGTELLGGTLRVDNAGALGTVGPITFTVGTGLAGPVGGTLQYGTGITTDHSARILNSTGSIAIDTNGNNVLFGSALAASNTNGLNKTGAGTLTLGAANLYTGATAVNAGTLAVGTAGVGSITSNVTVAANATLGGSGTVDGTVTIAGLGNIAPGNSVGTLTLTNGLVDIQSTAKYQFEIDGSQAIASAFNDGTSTNLALHDQILKTGTGNLNFTGVSVVVAELNTFSFDSTMTYSWTIAAVTGGSLNVTGGSVDLTGATALGTAVTNGLGFVTLNTNGNNYNLNYSPVPEPATILAWCAAAAAGAGYIRRRRTAKAAA